MPAESTDQAIVVVARNGDFAVASRDVPRIHFFSRDAIPKGVPIVIGGGTITGMAMLPDGRVLVATLLRPGRIVSSSGSIQTVSTLADDQVVALANGGFLAGHESASGVFVQEYDAAVQPVGQPVQVAQNAHPTFQLATNGYDKAIVHWTDKGNIPDGSRARLIDLEIAGAVSFPTRLRLDDDDSVIPNGGRLTHEPTELRVSFIGPLHEGSTTSPTNWRLTRNGDDVSNLVSSIYVVVRAENINDAVISFSERLPFGAYVLTALDSLAGGSGLPIDGDLDGLPGGEFSTSFVVINPGPSGDEFRVNQTTASDQRTSPASLANTAMRADGTFVTTWASMNQDGSGWGVYARLFDAQSQPPENEFRVNQATAGDQRFSTVAMEANGDFVVTWTSDGQDGSGYGVYARRFTSVGTPIANEFRVNATTVGEQGKSSIAMDDDGDFVVVWESKDQDGFGYGVYGRRYNANGQAQGSEFPINQTILSDQRLASVAMEPDGEFVVTWTSFNQDGSGDGIYARRYDALAQPLGDEFRVNMTTLSTQRFARIAMDRSGDFTVAWMSNAQDGDGYGIYAQRFHADGQPRGSEFRVNQNTVGHQQHPVVGMDHDGDTVIAWASLNQDGNDFGVYARRYSPGGVAQGDEFRVNTTTAGQQNLPSIGVDADGDFTIVWNSVGQDGDGFGVYAQRYSANSGPTADAGGPYTVQEGNALALNAGASTDPDQGETLTFSWDLNGDGAFGDAVGASPTLAWAQLAALGINDGPAAWDDVRVRATDTAGNVDEASTSIDVVNVAPIIALAGAATVNEGATYSLTLGAITDPGADTVTQWTVRWGDGTSNTYTSGGAKTHVYANGAATNTIRVDLTDEDGAYANAATKQVAVNNITPDLSGLNAASISENGTTVLHGTIADPGSADTYTLQIFWGDSGTPQIINLPAGTTSFEVPHQYLDDPAGPPPDEFPIDVILRDSDSAQDTGSIRLVVQNVAPEASILGLQTEYPVGELVALTAGVVDPGTLDVFAYDWRAERNGVLLASGTQQSFSFTPDAEGTYVVRLTIQDDDGGGDTIVATVRVPGGASVAGDTNGDGLVDLLDLNNVRNNFGGVGPGDTNDDGIVDLVDLNAVRNNFGAGGAPPSLSSARSERALSSVAQSNRNADAVFRLIAEGKHEDPLSLDAFLPIDSINRVGTFIAKQSHRKHR